ncbi:MAG: GIY-YIG nuclease family protein [Candidatus Paceibacterota bacterium]
MKREFLKKIAIPNKPGVYYFLSKGKIIYIGKATSLKNRTKSYFSKDLIRTRGLVTTDMVFKADNLKWSVTDSVLEALILESNLIKKYQPYHNIREKDDKSFLCVVITKEPLPRVFTARARNLKGHSDILKNVGMSKVYGPFTNGAQLREAVNIIRKIFPFLDDKSKNYLEFYRQINLAPDLKDSKLYLQNIKNIKLFFAGKKKQILKNLKKEMGAYAKRHEFEKAGEIKRQMFALKHINDIALVKNSLETRVFPLESNFRIEAYDIAHLSGKSMAGVMTVVENGEVTKSEYKKFKIRTQAGSNDTGALREVLERRLKHEEWTHPSLIVVDGGIAQINVATSIIKKMKLTIPVVSVLKDERHKPKAIMGDEKFTFSHKSAILLANSEAHRFAIAYHKNMRGRNFLPKLKKKNAQ